MAKIERLIITVMLIFTLLGALSIRVANSEPPIPWDISKIFQYNIHNASVKTDALGNRTVEVLFSVTDPTNGNRAWDIKTEAPFKQTPALSRIAIDIGWNAVEYSNTGASGEQLLPLPFGSGYGSALPISIDALKNAVDTGGHKYRVTAALPAQAKGTGVAAVEGHPAWSVLDNGTPVYVRVPVTSIYAYFPIDGEKAEPRRNIVSIDKCKVCHNDVPYDRGIIPRLTLHGANRTEEPQVCVICHNPEQTDIPYRTSGPEVSIDFKRMVHSIHAGGKLRNPFVVVGRQGALNDFSFVRFPRELRNCLNCHTEENGKGTFELPLASSVRGSTIDTQSVPGVSVDLDPANNLRITPTASVCSSCHDSRKAISHMSSRTAGGAFGVSQAQIDSKEVQERCVSCHGPGKVKDIRRIHEVGQNED